MSKSSVETGIMCAILCVLTLSVFAMISVETSHKNSKYATSDAVIEDLINNRKLDSLRLYSRHSALDKKNNL